VLIFAFRVALWQGWLGAWQVVRISGGSMGENLPGEHVPLKCPDCGFAWIVDAESWRRCSETVCPNCCWTRVERQEQDLVQPGAKVTIDRGAYLISAPQRFEVVAFKQPDTNQELAVKRLIGLPGESVRIQRGDLYVDEKIVRKTPAQFLSMALLVHDDPFRPSHSNSNSKWRGWIETESGHAWQGRGGEQKVHWLNHVRTTKFHGGVHHHAPFDDYDSFNPALPRRLQKVSDLAVRGKLSTSGAVELHFRIHDGFAWRERTIPSEKLPSAGEFLFGYWDQTLWMLIDGQVIAREEVERGKQEPSSEFLEQQISIGGGGEGSITLQDLQIFRDIYYLSPTGRDEPWQFPQPLHTQEFFLLGDNQPLSIDSRHWERGITFSEVVGKVFEISSE
jgi:signal peptidase I